MGRPRVTPPDRDFGGRRPKSGARALSKHIRAGTLDQRSWVAKALGEIRRELAADAGGLDHLTAREIVLIDRCAAAALICSTIEGHVFGRGNQQLVDDAGELLPILRRGYVSHVQSLSRMLQALGLKPDNRAERLPDLHAYLQARAAEQPPEPAPTPGDDDPGDEDPGDEAA